MHLSILWHHHQPTYRDPENGQYLLPYVNYHLTKNYYQMACLTEESGFPCVFNLVPCLLEQVEDYSRGQARDPFQEALEKDPQQLTASDVVLLSRFLPRGEKETDNKKLQLRLLRSIFSPVIQTGQDKDSLLSLQKEVHKKVIPFYKRLWLGGKAELTTSAYYHPLLPLLFDLGIGNEPIMPTLPFKYPEDGEAQIEKGREYFNEVFGRYPSGFWPSEGGISLDVARVIAWEGFSYAVTDENLLWKSLKKAPDRALLTRPYSCHNLAIFFRDRELSDLISFEYQRWDAKDAVCHFESKLDERMRAQANQAICVIALDGENPWAGYKDNGVSFLRELYSRLMVKEGLTPVLLKDYLEINPPEEEIELVPGTWLGNFSRWVGHPAKNAAWERLSLARQECGPSEEIFVAEGSDWFWWFGEDDPAGLAEFAALFDAYLRRARLKRDKDAVGE
ncbi:MAG: glycoside hydrolase family 57 protein [Clostridiales bacterium]|nr:glycoside hydrolase family 57 protein [Clostridiales bacterium]